MYVIGVTCHQQIWHIGLALIHKVTGQLFSKHLVEAVNMALTPCEEGANGVIPAHQTIRRDTNKNIAGVEVTFSTQSFSMA